MTRNRLIQMLLMMFTFTVLIGTTCFAASTLTVNTASSQGALMYGGIGFLYGLALNTPNDAMITGLVHPQYTGQNAPNGLQHPDGYADRVAPQAKRTGFKGVDIYCQDIYSQWPYQNLGINDYLAKLDTMARIIVADPNRSFYTYNIFNEPDLMWYSSSGIGLTNMCNDWKKCYDKIKSIDSTAKTMGPGFSSYNNSAYSTFFNFCRTNNCMPDVAVWHELQDSFYTSWYTHYNNFRAINSTIPIRINEYGRSSGDLGNPGNLIQHLAKYENSNVYGCLAYWTGHGTLNDLVANNNTDQHAVGSSFNQPTGAWYLYQWYGQMTGNQVAVTPPSQEGSLQGIASKDGNNVTVLFGGGATGSTFDVNLVVQGLSGSSVNYTVYETTNTGRNTAPAPSTKKSGTASVSGGSATISVTGCLASSAFKVYLTPAGTVTPTPTPTPGSYIKIRNRATNLCIDGMGSTSNGANACQYTSNTSTNQQWILEATGSYYKIKNRTTGLYLDGMGRTTNGSICGQYSSSTSNNQQWTREAAGSYYKFKNRATGLYLDGMGSTTNGANLCQYGSSSSNNQQWSLVTP